MGKELIICSKNSDMLFYQGYITLQSQFPMRQYSLCAPGTPLLPTQPSSEIRAGSRPQADRQRQRLWVFQGMIRMDTLHGLHLSVVSEKRGQVS